MKCFLLIPFLLFSLASFGQINACSNTTLFAHLNEVNSEWNSNSAFIPTEQVSFKNDQERIHHHLILAEEVLRAKKSDHLSESQRLQRNALLDTLSSYSARKLFPKNSGHTERTPYFIDASGVYCAVGYLIQKSGYQDLALQVNADHNFDYIRDIKTKGISEWAYKHGFTLDELALIQPTYAFKNNPGHQTLGGGTNGAVKRMAMDELHNRLYIIGDFDSLNASGACSQFAYYDGNILNCIDQNLHGNLVDLAASNGKIYVSGQIDALGQKYSFAIYQKDSLHYFNVPDREGMLATTIFPGTDNFQLEIVLENKSVSEIWRLDLTNNWTHIASARGHINSIARGEGEIVYAGAFDSFTVSKASETMELATNNIVKRSINDDNWSVLSGQIAEEVLKVKWRENNFFFAGSDSKGRAFGMTHNGSVLALSSPWCYSDSRGSSRKMIIHDFELSADSTFTIVGDFYVGLTYEAYNEATFSYRGYKKKLTESENPVLVSMLGSINYQQAETPLCILIYNHIIYTGGAFNKWHNIQYIHQFKPPYLHVQIRRLSDVRYQYSSNILTLEGANVKKVKIYDYSWNLIKKGRGNEIKTKGFPTGLYYAALELEYGHKITLSFWSSDN